MKKISLYLTLFILLPFCVFSYFNTFIIIENNIEDSIFQKSSPIDSRIVILGVDDTSIEEYGQWPISRNYVANLINILSKGGASAIGVDFIYTEESHNTEEDAALVDAVKNADNVVMPVYGNFNNEYIKNGKMEPDSLKVPFSKLKEVSAQGEINTIIENGIVRKSLTSFNYKGKKINSFAEEIYNQYLKKTGQLNTKINIPTDGWNRTYITYTSKPNSDTNKKSMYSYEHFPINKVLNGEIPPEYFKNKIVLLGTYSNGHEDSYLTTINHNIPMHGIEIHANILQNLLDKNFKEYIPDWLNIIFLILWGILCYFIFSRLRPIFSAILVVIFVNLHISLCKIAFKKGYIIHISYPIAFIIILYIIFLSAHYINIYLEKERTKSLFVKYVSPQVVNKILNDKDKRTQLGGISRMVSILFVDIRNFTPLSEKYPPEVVVDILNQYFDLTSKAILDNLGMLDKFIGDATMAVFNAPLDLDDYAFKAVKAAWEMKQGSDELKRNLLEKFGVEVEFGIGINTGYAVIGNIGCKKRMDYTAIGDTVNTSARLGSIAKPGQILISESTYNMIKNKVSVIPLGEVTVKGKDRNINIYELTGLGDY